MLRASLTTASLLLIGANVATGQTAGQRVNVNGMQMYYEVSGAGDPLIVLHGAYMNIPSMGAIIPKLAKTHRVYALELQGHGRTTDIDRPITYPNLADDVAAFMDAVGLKKADVFGYSMGAAVGLQLAIRHPAKVNKLVAASVAYDVERLAAGVQGHDSADDGGDDRRDAVRRGVSQARAQSRRLPRAGQEADRAREGADGVGSGREGAEDCRCSSSPATPTSRRSSIPSRCSGCSAAAAWATWASRCRPRVSPSLPATSHTAVITQADLLHAFIEPFLKGQTPKGMFEGAPSSN